MEITWSADISTSQYCCIFVVLRITLAYSLAAERLTNVTNLRFGPGVTPDASG